MKRQRKPTFDEWMHFLRETKKLRARERKSIKTPMFLVIPAMKPVERGLAEETD